MAINQVLGPPNDGTRTIFQTVSLIWFLYRHRSFYSFRYKLCRCSSDCPQSTRGNQILEGPSMEGGEMLRNEVGTVSRRPTMKRAWARRVSNGA
ncbi:hypothetical protein SORBI_3003G085750 [Sorghum bicolor]|uniref:Uncharacterized protein n=1 Tax=Sorghum bicolor TaxID=4558 RepID=A0A1W0VW84_SORBI|nr:hypothetical protein SORBI_3003G085750 [Sorghum bicolor]